MHVGTHTSIAGGPELAFERSAAVGGDTLQIFAKSPRGRSYPTYTDEQIANGKVLRKKYHQHGGLIHSNYLINLSKPAEQITKEIESVLHDFHLAHELGYDAINIHIGKQKGYNDLDEPMRNMTQNVEKILKTVRDRGYDDVQFVFENTAGQGSEIGSTIEELGYFWKTYLHDLPIKFCLDTAHCRGGGIDVGKRDDVLNVLEKQIGIEQIFSIHLNDAKVALGSKLDRHASLGRGFIGRPKLTPVIQRAAKNQRNLYIETPEPDLRPDEITKVKQIIAGETGWIEKEHAKVFCTQCLKKFAPTQETLFS